MMVKTILRGEATIYRDNVVDSCGQTQRDDDGPDGTRKYQKVSPRSVSVQDRQVFGWL